MFAGAFPSLPSTSATSAPTKLRAPVSSIGWCAMHSKEEIDKHTVKELLSLKREDLMADVKGEVLEKVRGAKPWGVDVVGGICASRGWTTWKRSPIPSTAAWKLNESAWPTNCVPPVALKAKRSALMLTVNAKLPSPNAYRDAQKIKGEGDAEAARIYAEAFGRDPAVCAVLS